MIIESTEEERDFLEKACTRIMLLNAKQAENPELFETPLKWAKDMGKIGFLIEKLRRAK